MILQMKVTDYMDIGMLGNNKMIENKFNTPNKEIDFSEDFGKEDKIKNHTEYFAIENMKTYGDEEGMVHLRTLLLIKNGSDVLSLGCGSGREVKQLVSQCCKVTAIDIQERMIEESRHIEPNAFYINGDALKFELPNSFDYIVCLWNTINRFEKEDKKRLIELCYKNLRKGGTLLITTKTRYSSLRLWLKHFQNKFEETYYYNPEDIAYWFKDTKFKWEIKKEDLGNNLIIAKK